MHLIRALFIMECFIIEAFFILFETKEAFIEYILTRSIIAGIIKITYYCIRIINIKVLFN